MCSLEVGMFGVFLRNTIDSHSKELQSSVRLYYVILGVVVSAWFLTLPITVAMAYLTSTWFRFRSVLPCIEGGRNKAIPRFDHALIQNYSQILRAR